MLIPISSVERWRDLRVSLERNMDDKVFYAMRREFHYDKRKIGSSFYKTVELVFCPETVRQGFPFGAWVVVDARTGTKSVTFTDFVSAAPHVSLRLLYPWTEEERGAIVAGLVDIHPPPPLDVPSKTSSSPVWTDAQHNFDKYLASLASFKSAAAAAAIGNGMGGGEDPTLVYYVRSSKLCDDECARALQKFFIGLERAGRLRSVRTMEERVNDEVGGWRLELKMSLL